MNDNTAGITLSDLHKLNPHNLMQVETYIEDAALRQTWGEAVPQFAAELAHKNNCDPAHSKVFEYLRNLVRDSYRKAVKEMQPDTPTILLPYHLVPEMEDVQAMSSDDVSRWFFQLTTLRVIGPALEEEKVEPNYLEDLIG